MTTNVRGVQPREVEAIWPAILALVEDGLRHAGGCFAAADVKQSLAAGRRQLWIDGLAPRCILITELIEYPLRRVLHVFLASGRLPRDWRDLWRGIERWAASDGCAAVEIRGRPGWARRLPDYRATMIFLRKELTA